MNKGLHANLKKRGMKFAHVNITTLSGHYADAEVLMEKAALDVFAVTESRLDCTLLDSKICPSGYTCYRKDRNRNGGGCAVFVRSKWPSKRRSDLESNSLEMVCEEICPEKAKNMIFAVMYKPPNMNQEKFISGLEQEFLAKLDDERVKDLIIMGDFNADVIALKPCKYTRKLMQTTRLHGLSQLIKEPTRVTEFTNTAIDLVFVNNTNRIVSHGVQEFGAGDHSVTFTAKKAGVCKAHVEIRDVRSFKHYNKEHFQRDIASVPWSVIESFDDINDAVVAWNNLFVDVANQHAPLKRIRTKHASKPWITNDLKELMAERDYALRVAKRSGNQEQWNEYRRLKNFTNRKIKSAETLHYKNLIESAENPKDMWRSLNSVIGSNNQGGSPFQVHDGKRLVSEPKSVATKFNKFFAAIGSKVAGRLNPVSKDAWKKYETVKEANKKSGIESTWDLQRVEQKTVQRILHSLKVNKAAGLDKIPARLLDLVLLKDVEMELAPSITYRMNKSISDGIVPDLWKVARVTPLHKSDDKLQVENYRPISVLPVLSKVVERVVHSQLNAHLHQLDFLYQHQYGFRRGYSTEQAITQLNNWVLESMDEGKVTGLLFIDISKAFDSLNHKVLLRKLEHLGLSERSLRWFRSYLTDRKQSVLINGELSEPHTITLGVPQGSILGPLLFNVYINSLPNAVKRPG